MSRIDFAINMRKLLFCWNQIDFLAIFHNKIAIGLFRLDFAIPSGEKYAFIFSKTIEIPKVAFVKSLFFIKAANNENCFEFSSEKRKRKFLQCFLLFILFVFFVHPTLVNVFFYISNDAIIPVIRNENTISNNKHTASVKTLELKLCSSATRCIFTACVRFSAILT